MSQWMNSIGASLRKAYLAIPERYRPIAAGFAIWLFLTAAFLLQTGVVPKSKLGWLLVVSLGPILAVVGGFVVAVAVFLLALVTGNAKDQTEIEASPARQPAVLSQLTYRLSLLLLFGAVLAIAAYLTQLAESPSGVASWFRQNFSLR